FASQVYETQDRGPQAASDDGGNICTKTLSAWRAAGGGIGPLAIHIEKHIPVGAGLGGGSGDAAALLRWLQTYADRPIADDQLFDLALEIGADVPACLVNKPLRMRGIGDVIETLEPAPAGPVLLASPGVLLSTKRVFTALAHKDADRDDMGPASWPLLADPEGLTMAEIASRGNDLQAEAIAIAPEIGALLQLMTAQDGAVTAQMTGSGSACFALFETSALCDAAEAALNSHGLWAVSTRI
ncbi:MAG: 4-(cytidine 5'-diphospho)-2-C-methyl-D-erythritol kinase, partial [Alphaproteobacteria bacterium]|nr:4-(cytidine 5'-diphospho)-2-C-methyl-D-erythritol kinase [Alphaproteobacteria bacterium]